VKFSSLLAIILFSSFFANAQVSEAIQVPQLPAMQIVTDETINILSWNSQYHGIKSIAIQRFSDSLNNFVTIGLVTKPKIGLHSYTDIQPLVGVNSYRLLILFAGDVEWFSNTYQVITKNQDVDHSIVEPIRSNKTTPASTPPTKPAEFVYTPSARIYTNATTKHIQINLEDALSKKYSIRFFDPSKNEILRISRVIKTKLILDKNNFNSKGTYSFQLFDGSILIETGYITVY
jgi:hypothetical protein